MQAARREHSQALEYDTDLPTYDFPPGGSDGDTTAFEIKFTPTQNTMLGWVPYSPLTVPLQRLFVPLQRLFVPLQRLFVPLTAIIRTLTVPLQVRADAEHHAWVGALLPAKEIHKS
jgi:hypothetical protein